MGFLSALLLDNYNGALWDGTGRRYRFYWLLSFCDYGCKVFETANS